jgi:hypothetical protein
VGQKLKARLTEINVEQGFIDFELVDTLSTNRV